MAILEMRNISKQFFGVTVLHGVNLTVEQGTCHALLGENGAGKSTLMNILTGVYTKDNGVVMFEDKEITNASIKKTEALGIAFIHQELNPINHLKVYENIFINNEITYPFIRTLNVKQMIKETQALFDDLGVDIDPKALVGDLTTGEKQLLEISRALHQNAKLVILDEPTTALSNAEIDNLFRIVNNLKKQGKTFIFISHKMPEIFRLADEYTVFRNGYYISTGKIKDVTPDQLTRDIVGKEFANQDIYTKRKLGHTILEIENLSGKIFKNVNLSVKKGEIIGLTGLQGSGVSELLQTLFGALKPSSGNIKVNGKYVNTGSVKSAMKKSIGMIASNRKENSIIPDMSLLENTIIAEHQLSSLKFHISYKKEVKKFNEYKDVMAVKCNSEKELITSLSGGNQQKVIIARWLDTESDIILMDNPTQGIDVGAKEEIYKLILRLAQEGKTILFNTLEINEIKKIADRCVIFYHGKIEKILEHKDVQEELVMTYATHANKVTNVKEGM